MSKVQEDERASPKPAKHRFITIGTLVCITTAAVYLISVKLIPRGPEALGLIVPLFFMEAAHVLLGLPALLMWFRSGAKRRLAWVPAYFLVFAYVHMLSFGGRLYTDPDAPFLSTWESVVDGRTAQLRRALSSSGFYGHSRLDEVRRLVQAGADVNLRRSRDGATPLYWAVSIGDIELVQEMLERDADPNRTLDNGTGPLHVAVERGQGEMVEMLLAAGARVDVHDEYGGTPFAEAFLRGEKTLLAALVGAGADPNAPLPVGGERPLWVAVYKGDSDMIETLLALDVETEFRAQDNGASPLALALQRDQDTLALRLLASGADALYPDQRGVSPLLVLLNRFKDSTRGRSDRVARLVTVLDKPGEEISAATLYEAELPGTLKFRVLEQLLAAGARLPADGEPDISDALSRPDYLAALLLAGADANAKTRDGRTPLVMAIGRGSDYAVRLLLVMGVAPNRPDSRWGLPLTRAIVSRDCKAIDWLLAAGADPNLVDEWGTQGAVSAKEAHRRGRSPVEMALLYARRDALRKLVSAGGDIPDDAEELVSYEGVPGKYEGDIIRMLWVLEELGMQGSN